jgi:uncharacterized membrane protein
VIRALGLAAALAAGPAAATQEYILPTLFDVTGVAADDVLNVRAGPDAGAEILGTLAPDAERIEVVAQDADGVWGQVNVGERAGWVALRFLAYRTDVWEAGRLPEGLRCFGTEPFWSMRPDWSRLVVATPEAEAALELRAVLGTGVFRDPTRALVAEGEGRRVTLVATPGACSDGMSDRAFGLVATAVVEEGGAEPGLVAGCCSIAP